MEFCHKVIPTRSQYADVAEHKCHCPKGHSGKCEEFPFLNHLKSYTVSLPIWPLFCSFGTWHPVDSATFLVSSLSPTICR